MKREFMRLAGGLALAAALVSVAPCAAFAAGTTADTQSEGGISEITPQADEPVATIVETDVEYATFAEAALAAEDGQTIELLEDCESALTQAWAINKNIRVTGNHTVTFEEYSFGITGENELILDGCTIVVNNASKTAYSDNPANAAIMLDGGATLTLDNGATLVVDKAAGDGIATWDADGEPAETVNIRNGSTYICRNCSNGGGFEDYNAASPYNTLNISGESTVSCVDNYSGIIGTWNVNVTDSTLEVLNSTGNGSNGAHFLIDNSSVTFNNNSDHGLSTGKLTIQNKSVVTANANGRTGVNVGGGDFKMDGTSTLIANNNGAKHWGAGVNLTTSGAKGEVASGAIIEIVGNGGDGLDNQRTTVMYDGAKVTITNNSDGNGGGIYNPGNLTLPSDAQVYNNHATTSGDDIYSTGSITFGHVGSDWKLDDVDCDGNPDDCTDTIDGWYVDVADARWEAHADSYDGIHVKEYTFEGATTTVTGPLALKAAHGLGVVAVDPADITIYMGGDEGYEGTATENGSISGSNSLPEPGFYFVLSDDINQAFAEADIADLGVAADLSQYMTIYTHGYNGENGELHWKLEKYGENNSEAYGQFIYRIVPAPTAGQEAVPVRLQFTGEDGTTVTSDEFDPSAAGTLSQKYTMQLYTELVQKDQVVFEVDIKGQKFYNSMELQTGDLNVRYVTGDQDDVVSDVLNSEAELAAAKAEDPNKAFALHPEGTTYYINNSKVDIADGIAPSLLFDDVVSDHNTTGAEDYDQQLASRAVDVATSAGADFENPYFQAKYLDLVDANNGNVWLTASEPTTVYWPYPAGTNENTEFHLVHFTDLDREMNNSAIDGAIDSSATEYVAVKNTEHGIRFTTDGFSPFVLIWDAGTEAGPQPEPPVIPTEPSKPGNGLPTTGDYSLMGAAAAAVAGIAVIGCGIHMARKSH